MAVVAAFDGGDMGAVQAAVGAMGKDACGGCHEAFRGPKVD
jgi:cytochrome c556